MVTRRSGSCENLSSTSGQIQNGERSPNFSSLNCKNSAAGRSISLRFGTEFEHVTAATDV